MIGASNGYDLVLNWSQQRPDLVQSYEIQVSIDGQPFVLTMRIGSGAIQTATFNGYLHTSEYRFRLRALNQDGASDWSNDRGLSSSGNVCNYGTPRGSKLNVTRTVSVYDCNRTTTPPPTRAYYEIGAMTLEGTVPWQTVSDPLCHGGSCGYFTSDGGTQKVSGSLNLTQPSMVFLSYKAISNSAGFTFSVGSDTVMIPNGSADLGWRFIPVAEKIFPIGTLAVDVVFTNPATGKMGYLDSVIVVPVVDLETFLYGGRKWVDSSLQSWIHDGSWASVARPLVFPESVTTISDNAYVSDQTGSALWIPLYVPQTITKLQLDGFNAPDLSGLNVFFNGVLVATYDQLDPLVSKTERSSIQIPVTQGYCILKMVVN